MKHTAPNGSKAARSTAASIGPAVKVKQEPKSPSVKVKQEPVSPKPKQKKTKIFLPVGAATLDKSLPTATSIVVDLCTPSPSPPPMPPPQRSDRLSGPTLPKTPPKTPPSARRVPTPSSRGSSIMLAEQMRGFKQSARAFPPSPTSPSTVAGPSNPSTPVRPKPFPPHTQTPTASRQYWQSNPSSDTNPAPQTPTSAPRWTVHTPPPPPHTPLSSYKQHGAGQTDLSDADDEDELMSDSSDQGRNSHAKKRPREDESDDEPIFEWEIPHRLGPPSDESDEEEAPPAKVPKPAGKVGKTNKPAAKKPRMDVSKPKPDIKRNRAKPTQPNARRDLAATKKTTKDKGKGRAAPREPSLSSSSEALAKLSRPRLSQLHWRKRSINFTSSPEVNLHQIGQVLPPSSDSSSEEAGPKRTDPFHARASPVWQSNPSASGSGGEDGANEGGEMLPEKVKAEYKEIEVDNEKVSQEEHVEMKDKPDSESDGARKVDETSKHSRKAAVEDDVEMEEDESESHGNRNDKQPVKHIKANGTADEGTHERREREGSWGSASDAEGWSTLLPHTPSKAADKAGVGPSTSPAAPRVARSPSVDPFKAVTAHSPLTKVLNAFSKSTRASRTPVPAEPNGTIPSNGTIPARELKSEASDTGESKCFTPPSIPTPAMAPPSPPTSPISSKGSSSSSGSSASTDANSGNSTAVESNRGTHTLSSKNASIDLKRADSSSSTSTSDKTMTTTSTQTEPHEQCACKRCDFCHKLAHIFHAIHEAEWFEWPCDR